VSRAILLDGNVLVGLTEPSHVHHAIAQKWFQRTSPLFATCPITQYTLIRVLVQLKSVATVEDAIAVLKNFLCSPRSPILAR
jgi:uncharacterized protein